MRISDWSSDVCSSDLRTPAERVAQQAGGQIGGCRAEHESDDDANQGQREDLRHVNLEDQAAGRAQALQRRDGRGLAFEIAAHRVADADAADQQRRQAHQGEEEGEAVDEAADRSEEHTSELQSLMRTSYA